MSTRATPAILPKVTLSNRVTVAILMNTINSLDIDPYHKYYQGVSCSKSTKLLFNERRSTKSLKIVLR